MPMIMYSIVKVLVVMELGIVHHKGGVMAIKDWEYSFIEKVKVQLGIPSTNDGLVCSNASMVNSNQQGDIPLPVCWLMLLSNTFSSRATANRTCGVQVETSFIKEDIISI